MKMKIVIHETGSQFPDLSAVSKSLEIKKTADLPGDAAWSTVFSTCALFCLHKGDDSDGQMWARAFEHAPADCLMIRYSDDWISWDEINVDGRRYYQTSHTAIKNRLSLFLAKKIETNRWHFDVFQRTEPHAALTQGIHAIENLIGPMRWDAQASDSDVDAVWSDYFAQNGYLSSSRGFQGTVGIEAMLASLLDGLRPFVDEIRKTVPSASDGLLGFTLSAIGAVTAETVRQQWGLDQIRAAAAAWPSDKNPETLRKLLREALGPVEKLTEQLRVVRSSLTSKSRPS